MDEKIEIPMAFWRDIKNALNQYVEEEGGKDGENHCWENANDVSKKMETLETHHYYKQHSLATYEKEKPKAVPVALWTTVVEALARFVKEADYGDYDKDSCWVQGNQAIRTVYIFETEEMGKEPS